MEKDPVVTAHFAFDNSYARLPDPFFVRALPTAAKEPRLIKLNRPLAEELGLDPDALRAVRDKGPPVLPGVKQAPHGFRRVQNGPSGWTGQPVRSRQSSTRIAHRSWSRQWPPIFR